MLTSQNKEFTSQDKELLSVTSERRLSGYFWSETVFNLSRKILTATKIEILEKGLDLAPEQ